jgi:BirA family transcriptional regulator, biotin operon repressor / biotin---[acetyl-CoA-carboxylase] ligase
MSERLESLNLFDTVRARLQTAGRGRLDRIWYSGVADENLAFSMLIPITKNSPGEISARVGFALWQILGRYANVNLRWPNDIVCGGKKLAGVLTNVDSRYPHLAITGIGVNINGSAFPEPISEMATSLFLETGHKLRPQKLWREVWQRVKGALSGVEEGLSRDFISAYNTAAWRFIARADVDAVPLQFQSLLADGRALCLASAGPVVLDMAV